MEPIKYKEHEIELLPSGIFSTVVNGVRISKPSLAALKKAISDKGKTKFEPFVALKKALYGKNEGAEECPGYLRVKIVDVAKTERGKPARFIEEDGSSSGYRYGDVCADTPENIAAINAYEQFKEETRRIKEEREQIEFDLRDAIKEISAESFFK